MSSLSSQANRLQTVIRRHRKRAPFIEESQLSAKEPKKKKTKKNEEVVVWYGFECEHCPKDGTDDTDKQKADKHLQRLCLCKKKTYETDINEIKVLGFIGITGIKSISLTNSKF